MASLLSLKLPRISIASAFTAFVVLSLLQSQLPNIQPFLLERFFPGSGWIEVAFLSLYAGWLAGLLIDPKKTRRIRPLLWRFFSLVFFGQLILGLLGFSKFLMTGKLHLPIPALIVAGPIYRGSGFFMLFLFLATVLLVGPAWCSHLCYLGSWDDLAARSLKRPKFLPAWQNLIRWFVFFLVIFGSLLLRWLGVSTVVVLFLAGGFGLVGIAFMIFWSKKTGTMTHCVVYCPIGILSNLLGKFSLFRIKISLSCNDCGACSRVCRFAALFEKNIQEKRPGLTCTLCGDCVGVCHENAIGYRLLGLSYKVSRSVFVLLITVLHTLFLGVARI